MHDKIEKFRAVGDDGKSYLVVRIRPYRRSDTLEGVGGYLDFAPLRLSSGEVLEPASSPRTFKVPGTGVVLTVESPEPWASGRTRTSPLEAGKGGKECDVPRCPQHSVKGFERAVGGS